MQHYGIVRIGEYNFVGKDGKGFDRVKLENYIEETSLDVETKTIALYLYHYIKSRQQTTEEHRADRLEEGEFMRKNNTTFMEPEPEVGREEAATAAAAAAAAAATAAQGAAFGKLHTDKVSKL